MREKLQRYNILCLETAQEQKCRRQRQSFYRQSLLDKIESYGICEGFYGPCYNAKNISWCPSMTRYPWDKDKEPNEDPNRDLFLCDECYDSYKSHWVEMWNEYYAGRL